jgi:hypothetical protein
MNAQVVLRRIHCKRGLALNINSTVGWLTDELSDYVGIRAGLAITAADVVRLLKRELETTDEDGWFYSPRPWLYSEADRAVRIRAEEFESLFVRVMYAVGALPDPLTQNSLVWKFAAEHSRIADEIPPFDDEEDFPFPAPPAVRLIWLMGSNPSDEPLPDILASLQDDYNRRSIINLMLRTEKANWDGLAPLESLFHITDLGGHMTANIGSPPLIDQRFIDYLHAQPEDLSRMHWRQFEFLAGEFFRRNNYEVHITPASGDGGVDARAIRNDGVVGPELILIQAKRYGPDHQVGIETVKALWSDVKDESATRGVIATTSTLASGARAFCEARRYQLTGAARPTVESWLQRLATFPRPQS